MEPEWNHNIGEDDATTLGLRDMHTKVYINLNNKIDCNYLCKHVFSMLNNCISKKIDLSNSILCIEIRHCVGENTTKYIENSV